ncbi:MAG: histidine phosphatase family protein [Natronospirillum sp.]|uniref:SixA phosphatase family protein n=1 Tax=Natronospirillum sp. TaxID=2812955 RepID=UPI00260066AB|nr:histidine phosphatase family protein [Natronospirillum sp.]MCH8551305.1 histidine phosphatase family protein [Natronospirillum sp.]
MSTLYCLRHGEAEFGGAHDEMRRLTDRGVQQIRRAANQLPKQGLMLYHSPYVRTTESAQIVMNHVAVSGQQAALWLTPDARLDDTLAQLELLQGPDLLLVTHNPLVTRLTASLTGAPEFEVGFGTGSLARLDGEALLPGCMTLQWL